MRSYAVLACLAIACAAPTSVAQQLAAPPPRSIPPREYLQLFDINTAWLDKFRDGQPLDDTEHQQLLTLLYRLQQYPLAGVDQFSQKPGAEAGLCENPQPARGELFTLVGRVTRAQRVPLEASARQRFDFAATFTCTLVTDAGQTAMVEALAVPAAWRLDAPIDERASAQAMFVKCLPVADDKQAERMLFVTTRVAWYPDNVLGKLGMDFGLFDDVRDRAGLDERETFYQLLAAVRRAGAGALEREARAELNRQTEQWRRDVENPAADAAARTAARRGLDRAADYSSDVVPLFNDPAAMRGQLVTLRGEALRAIEVRVDDPDIVSRFDIRRYYEVEILTEDSQNNPLVCVVAHLPPGMPLGNNINVAVRVTGFFLKSWGFRPGMSDAAASAAGRRQLAPLLVADTVKVLSEPAAPGASSTMVAVLAAALAVAALILWWIWRGDRRALAVAQQARLELPERIDDRL
ncbi:MAG: hypothetical protein AB7O59_16005 [Pirellulales bacterium]